MTKKPAALLTLIGLLLGISRWSRAPFRRSLIFEILRIRDLRSADEIELNTCFMTVLRKDRKQPVLKGRFPLSDEEREGLKALLRLRLPSSYHCESRFEPDRPLAQQRTYRFIKTQA